MKNHNISISVWLGAFPEECIEYVVVHELTHLLDLNDYSNGELMREVIEDGIQL